MKSQAAALLNSVALRQTRPRIAILSVLLQAGAPISQEQIAERIGRTAPNKTTIYRTLTNLVDKNLVHKAYVQQRSWHYELADQCSEHQCHPHFTCRICKRTQCLPNVSVPTAKLPKGYQLQRQQVRIEGICRLCSKRKPK